MRASKDRLTLQEFLDRSNDVELGETFWEFSVRTSLVPSLLKSQVSEEVLFKVDEALREKREEGFSKISLARSEYEAMIQSGQKSAERQIPQTVESLLPKIAAEKKALGDDQLSSALHILQNAKDFPVEWVKRSQLGVEEARKQIAEVVHQKIREEVQKNRELLNQSIAAAKQSALGQIAAARRQVRAQIKERLDELQKESSIQEVVVRWARKIAPGRIVYLQFGKTNLDGAFVTDDDQRTPLESLKPSADLTTRLLSASATVVVGGGVVQEFQLDSKRTWRARLDLATFHYRLPFVDGNQFVTDFLQLSEEDYERNRELWNLDSGFARLVFDFDRFSAFVSGTLGQKKGFGAGFDWQFTRKNHLILSLYRGDEKIARQSISVYLTHEFSQKLSVYCGANFVEKFTNGEHLKWNAYDRKEYVVGASLRLARFPLIGNRDRENVVEFYAEGYCANNQEFEQALDFENQEKGLRLGMRLDWGGAVPTRLEKAQAEVIKVEAKIAKLQKQIAQDTSDLQRSRAVKGWGIFKHERALGAQHIAKLQKGLSVKQAQLHALNSELALKHKRMIQERGGG